MNSLSEKNLVQKRRMWIPAWDRQREPESRVTATQASQWLSYVKTWCYWQPKETDQNILEPVWLNPRVSTQNTPHFCPGIKKLFHESEIILEQLFHRRHLRLRWTFCSMFHFCGTLWHAFFLPIIQLIQFPSQGAENLGATQAQTFFFVSVRWYPSPNVSLR